MDALRFGRILRGIRRHLRLTQATVARRAGISQSVYSRAERGDLTGMTVGTLDRIAASIGASFVVDIRYQGGLGDRLVDAAHAALVEIVVGVLRRYNWEVEVEFTFNVFGDRGSVDVLAWHAATRTLLIIEVITIHGLAIDARVARAKAARGPGRGAGAARLGCSARSSWPTGPPRIGRSSRGMPRLSMRPCRPERTRSAAGSASHKAHCPASG